MIALGFPTDFWTFLLAAGILAMLVTTVSMILGLAPGKKVDRQAAVSPLRAATASAVRERAAAAARVKAAAAARERGIQLTDVREVLSAAGQAGRDGDGSASQQEPAVSPEEAEAIIAHYAENDPNRLAEVIIQWIKSDVNKEASSTASTPSTPSTASTPPPS